MRGLLEHPWRTLSGGSGRPSGRSSPMRRLRRGGRSPGRWDRGVPETALPGEGGRVMTRRYGIIGTGMMGQEHIRNLGLLAGARVDAIADPDPEMRAAGQRLAGPDCRAFPTGVAMLRDTRLDAVVVAAPNHTHHALLRPLLATEIPVLCEKPLAIDEALCREIERWQAARRAPLWVAMEYRYMPAIARLLAEVGRGYRRPAADAVHPGAPLPLSPQGGRLEPVQRPHRWHSGREVLSLLRPDAPHPRIRTGPGLRLGRDGGLFPGGGVRAGAPRHPGPRLCRGGLCLRRPGDAGSLHVCRGAHWQEEICVIGDRARIDARLPPPARFEREGRDRPSELHVQPRDRPGVVEEIACDPGVQAAGDHHGATFFQHQAFLRLLESGGEPAVSVRDGRISVAMGAAAEQSARTGRLIALG